MPLSSVNPKKPGKGLDSRKSQSWWWESHINPRNAKWLTENLDEMDHHYKCILKLIEGDGDSLAKKAEMYYERRPELLSHTEELYRMYKSLAERYEDLTFEIRKNLLPDLESQVSVGSDTTAEVVTSVPLVPELKTTLRRSSGHRAAGFDFFLGSGKSGLERHAKGDETASISNSETGSDVSSFYSYPVMDLEAYPHKKINSGSLRRIKSENFDDALSKMIDDGEELRMAKEKIRLSEEEIANLKAELQKFATLESDSTLQNESSDVGNGTEEERFLLEINAETTLELQESNTTEVDVSDPEQKIRALVEELRIAKSRLNSLDKEGIQLRKGYKESSESLRKVQELLKLSQQEAVTLKRNLESEKYQVYKLQDRISMYKASLADREIEVRELKATILDPNLKFQLHAEITRLTAENAVLEEKFRDWEIRSYTLQSKHEITEKQLNDEINRLRVAVAEKTEMLEALKSDLDEYKLKYDSVTGEKDELHSEISARNGQIGQLEKNLEQLVSENGRTCKEVDELRSRAQELIEEVERQKALISEGAEGKREAIRQLCFSLEHYRNGYEQLREAFIGHKQHHVLAS